MTEFPKQPGTPGAAAVERVEGRTHATYTGDRATVAAGAKGYSVAPPAAETAGRIAAAVAAMGPGPLSEDALRHHVWPLFERVRAATSGRVYLANHSLGRPLDATADDVAEGVRHWYERLGEAWGPWMDEARSYRERLARLLGSPRADCVVPRTSAGQGLRAVLNTWDRRIRVVATRGEFDSIDVILRHYARRGRLDVQFVEADAAGYFDVDAIAEAIVPGVDLVVLSQVVFNTGQALRDLGRLVAHGRACGARVLVDVYHALGVLPVDVASLDVDFAIGGSYKYLRGGPGACFLYVAPRWLDGSLTTLDIGWFAKREPFAYRRPDPPQLAEGGDAFLESTPPVLPFYQARSGQVLALALGVDRLRTFSLRQLQRLRDRLAERGIAASGGDDAHGAFLVVRRDGASALASGLRERGVVTDARGPFLRLCPDVLTGDAELDIAAEAVASAIRDR